MDAVDQHGDGPPPVFPDGGLDDPYFSRPTAARKAGLARCAAVPVLRHGEVTAVLAFFGPGEPGGQAAMFDSAAWLAELLGSGVPARSARP